MVVPPLAVSPRIRHTLLPESMVVACGAVILSYVVGVHLCGAGELQYRILDAAVELD